MKATKFYTAKRLTLLPAAGCFAFLLLYITAAVFYPGGSQADAHAKGFSWLHNYWCNLLNEKAINGQSNTARPFAYTAMIVMLATLMGFWAVAAHGLLASKRSRNILLFSGAFSLLLLPFLSTSYHDTVINASGFFGLIALSLVYAGLYKRDWYALFALGIFNLFLFALNNYLYYATTLYYLPLVQKITFASFLLWIGLVTIKLSRQRVAM